MSTKVTVSSVESDEKKKTVPALEKISGQDEDYFTWCETVINDLGRNGLGKFVLDKSAHELYSGQSESVFYALRSSLSGGLAASHADALYNVHEYNPHKLWVALKEYYNTTLNRANVNVFETKRLFRLTLDMETAALQFILDMKDCLQRLNVNEAKIVKDNDTLRAFLLVAIQDDDYDTVRNKIISHPDRDIYDLLSDIRTKDSALQLKEGVRRLQGDGAATTSRRATSSSLNKSGGVHAAIKAGK